MALTLSQKETLLTKIEPPARVHVLELQFPKSHSISTPECAACREIRQAVAAIEPRIHISDLTEAYHVSPSLEILSYNWLIDSFADTNPDNHSLFKNPRTKTNHGK